MNAINGPKGEKCPLVELSEKDRSLESLDKVSKAVDGKLPVPRSSSERLRESAENFPAFNTSGGWIL